MNRPAGVGAFQFVVLASLRAVQLTRGCVPKVEGRSEEHTSELQSQSNLVCRLLLEKKNIPICRRSSTSRSVFARGTLLPPQRRVAIDAGATAWGCASRRMPVLLRLRVHSDSVRRQR